MGYEVKNVTLSFQLGLIVFWRLSSGKDADLMFGNDNISVDAQMQTELHGVIKTNRSAASLPWDFPFLFACLYKDFFFEKT